MTNNVATAAPADEPEKPKGNRGRSEKSTNTPRPPKDKNSGRTSAVELEDRIHQVAEKIGTGLKKWQIKQWAYEKWNIAARTFEDYYTKAYKFLLSTAGSSPEEEFLKSCAFYDAMIADQSIPPETRLQARINKDKLTGIQRPKKLAMTDADGEIVSPASQGQVAGLTFAIHQLTVANLPTDQLEKLAAAAAIYKTVNAIDAQPGKGVITDASPSTGSK